MFFIIELKRGDAKVGPQLRATKLFVEFIINSIIRVNDGLSTNFFIGTIGVSLAKIEREREAKNMRKLKLRVTPCQFDNDNHMNYTKSKSFICHYCSHYEHCIIFADCNQWLGIGNNFFGAVCAAAGQGR